MADSLDEFFAKKDKSKKGKKKNVTPDDIAKQLEEGRKFEKMKKDKDKTNLSSSILSSNILDQQDEEWKDFEEEKEKDYSGLRIQTLSIKDKEEELREQQMQENGEDNKKENESAWKMAKTASSQSVTPDEPDDKEISEQVTEKVAVPNPEPSRKYVPPHLRNPTSQNQGQSLDKVCLGNTKRRLGDNKFGAPQIGDTMEFPSLGATIDLDTKGFQPVKHGSREVNQTNPSQVVLDNKFSALSGKQTSQDN